MDLSDLFRWKRIALPPPKRELEVVRGESFIGVGSTWVGVGFSGHDNLTIHGGELDVKSIAMTGDVTLMDITLPSKVAQAKDISPKAEEESEVSFPNISGKSVRFRNSEVRLGSLVARETVEVDSETFLIAERMACKHYLPLPGSVVCALIAHGDIPYPDEFISVDMDPPPDKDE